LGVLSPRSSGSRDRPEHRFENGHPPELAAR
jgi:hypothetical protein